MKTTKSITGIKMLAYAAIALFLFFTSCKDTETVDYNADDNLNLQTEASSDAELEDAADMGSIAMSADAGTLTGRSSEMAGPPRNINDKITDGRFKCATVTFEFAADNVPVDQGGVPHGFITIDFGAGCTVNGRVRKGKIVIEFFGRRFMPGSKVIITFEDYFINAMQIEGTRTETNVTASTESGPKFEAVTVVNVTFPDGTVATRNSTKTRQWIRASDPREDSWIVTGSAFGKTRKGVDYVMTITKALLFKRSCAISNKVVIPVEGVKELVSNAKKITIDFGNGECDSKVTITVNGKSKEVDVSGNGN